MELSYSLQLFGKFYSAAISSLEELHEDFDPHIKRVVHVSNGYFYHVVRLYI